MFEAIFLFYYRFWTAVVSSADFSTFTIWINNPGSGPNYYIIYTWEVFTYISVFLTFYFAIKFVLKSIYSLIFRKIIKGGRV